MQQQSSTRDCTTVFWGRPSLGIDVTFESRSFHFEDRPGLKMFKSIEKIDPAEVINILQALMAIEVAGKNKGLRKHQPVEVKQKPKRDEMINLMRQSVADCLETNPGWCDNR